MTTLDVLNRINALCDEYGPIVKEEEVMIGGVFNADKKEFEGGRLEKFYFKRLPYLEADKLRTRFLGKDGNFDPERYAGNNARMVALTLVDDNGELVADFNTVCMWPTNLVDAMAKAAQKVNGVNIDAKGRAEIAKNSEATPQDGSS